MKDLKMKEKVTTKKFIMAVIAILMVILAIGIYLVLNKKPSQKDVSNLPVFTLEEIRKYDGTDDNKPVYLVYNKDVYDVSAGRDYYKIGGSYHYIAGTDATKELDMFGALIIKHKYSIIGHIK